MLCAGHCERGPTPRARADVGNCRLSGPILVMPSIIASYVRSPTPAVRDALLARRLKLAGACARPSHARVAPAMRELSAGWLLGVMMLALFPNVSLFTQQVERHFDPSWATITPNDPLVLALRDKVCVCVCVWGGAR